MMIQSDLLAKCRKRTSKIKECNIQHVRRGTRKGYKAGALKHAMQTTDTDLVAIFDADFIPPTWFLKRAIPHFSKPDYWFSSVSLGSCK